MKRLYSVFVERLKNNEYTAEIFSRDTLDQFKRYLITGLMSFGVEYFLFIMLLSYVLPSYGNESFQKLAALIFKFFGIKMGELAFRTLTANTAVYIIVFWFNFLLNRYWSFKSKKAIGKQLRLYGMLFIFNLFAINGLIYFLTCVVGIIPEFSKILVMGAVISWNFVLYKKVIYK